MRCGWGPYFRRTFEVQAGNSPLQGQSKPPAKLVVLIRIIYSKNLNTPITLPRIVTSVTMIVSI
mgnify:CR=1 FL=1